MGQATLAASAFVFYTIAARPPGIHNTMNEVVVYSIWDPQSSCPEIPKRLLYGYSNCSDRPPTATNQRWLSAPMARTAGSRPATTNVRHSPTLNNYFVHYSNCSDRSYATHQRPTSVCSLLLWPGQVAADQHQPLLAIRLPLHVLAALLRLQLRAPARSSVTAVSASHFIAVR